MCSESQGSRVQDSEPVCTSFQKLPIRLLTLNRISRRTVAAAFVQVFDLEPTLDDKTREMLQIYQPLITQDTGLPVVATPPAPIVNTQDAIIEEKSNPTPSSENISEGETNARRREAHHELSMCRRQRRQPQGMSPSHPIHLHNFADLVADRELKDPRRLRQEVRLLAHICRRRPSGNRRLPSPRGGAL